MEVKAFETLELQYDKVQEVSDYIRKELSPEQRSRLSNLVKLIDGFQSALSLEVLATVDFIKKDNPGISHTDILKTIHKWSDRKRRLFQEKYIEIAANRLESYGSNLESLLH